MGSEPFEIVILNDHASVTGGSAAVALTSAVELANQDVRVTLFTCVGPVARHLENVPNLEVICLGQQEIAKNGSRLKAFAEGLRNGTAVRRLRDLLETKSPQSTIVHVHSWTKSLSPYALSLVEDMGFPLVATLHDFFISCPTGGLYLHNTGSLCGKTPSSLSCLSCNCDRRNFGHKVWRSVRTAIQNRVLHVPERCAYFIGVSQFSLDLLKPHLPAVPTRVVRNPIALKDSGAAPVSENRHFVYVGRFEEEKGVRLFAEAVRITGLPAVFIGDGALKAEIQKMCPNALFTGWLNGDQIREHLMRARALVFPPLWYETLGMVVLEATAYGVPPIVSDRCAATDFIREGETGLHFSRGDANALAEKMQLLASNGELAVQLGSRAYRWYWDNPWTAKNHVSELLEVYRELVPAVAAEAAILS